ncbi:DNA-binding protein [Streptomyces bingchenggensis BCW-1]|uniref:DNA-binding protein n=1 Tax=Streptomyces bingchenggensis (strain BCW-1) TaxID=749414 RepID=D7C0L4_STRBB|nr:MULTISPECIES: helix-turn-helix transcriptional regulator [Streptomyces]ADI03705.1 DNA-binding protein [Streptomyces bingchenggensis BCW-1]
MSGSIGGTGATGPTEDAEAFAELLRRLKERSGLSYGALAKRLDMSTSTLHRYCNGRAVPNDYAPVERLARVCRATGEELVELHRRWILADAARVRRGPGPDGTEPEGAGPGGSGSEKMAPGSTGSEPRKPSESDEPVVSGATPSAPARSRRRQTALIASVAAAAALATVTLTAILSEDDERIPAGDTTVSSVTLPADGTSPTDDTSPPASGSSSPSQRAKNGKPSASKSAEHTGGVTTERSDAVPVKVTARPYVYDNPCNQHFLVDSEPEQVGPPAVEQDAPRWAAAYGAVPAGNQRIALSVQGTGKDTVVLEALHVRVTAKGAPLAWNDYGMGVVCGGGGAVVKPESFDVDLDDGSPTVTVKNGQRDFPYKVSESNPEVFYVTAHTRGHDVRWDLALDWSSGDRHGTLHINNNGTSFRTSANAGRPGYNYQPGSNEWTKRGG